MDFVSIIRQYSLRHAVLAVLEFLVLSVATYLLVRIVAYDTIALDNQVSESSFTENLQLVFLGGSMFAFSYAGLKCNKIRPLAYAMGAVFLTFSIREVNNQLDAIMPGFWAFPASFVVLMTGVFLYLNRNYIGESVALFLQTRAYGFLLCGMVSLLVFSRAFGSGKIIWEPLMQEGYNSLYKNVIQEGVELYAYFLISYSALNTLLHFAWKTQNVTERAGKNMVETVSE